MTKDQLASAFTKGAKGSCHNATSNGTDYALHGNVICRRGVSADGLTIVYQFNWCGWYTPTTASHMNAILRAMGAPSQVSYADARDRGIADFAATTDAPKA